MRRLAISAILLSGLATASVVHAADKVRFAYTVQVHQAHMMVLQDYAKKYNIEIEPVPMRRYADQQLALMTNQVDVAVIGYVNVGLMEEKSFRDYRAIAGVSTGGHTISVDEGALNRSMVLENVAVVGSVNANRRHYEAAAVALAAADPAWLARLVNRRVPLAQWQAFA